jgi:uncharacterized lipoprotein YajG
MRWRPIARSKSALRVLAACVASSFLAGCGGSDRSITRQVETQLSIARDATIPAGVTLLVNSGPTRESSLVSAEWSFNVQVGWVTYRNEVITSLQKAGYELLTATGDSLAFARHVPGDSYRVSIARKESASDVVRVRFAASPD